MPAFWLALSRAARISLIAGGVAIVLLTAIIGWWMLRVDYQVLFADLKPQDAAAMTSELERQKIPYRLGEHGSAILVDKNLVHGTRIKLMGKELPLHGAVGFELFNNTDFGMTEFAQKINYQRALQGELTRTILALSEIQDARVHLALPEQGLFKQATSRAKAAITLTLRQGQVLRSEQVVGIQRLVAAAVPGMTMADVTLIDNQGVALSRNAVEGDADALGGGGSRFDLKQETENYLSRKAAAVLEQTFGAGQALASVDVTLNMDQIKTTTEEVIAAPARSGQAPTGVVVRERESVRETGAAPLDVKLGAPGSTQREVEYQVGRRVEQVVSQPGSVRRIQVVAVVRRALSEVQEEQVRRMVAAAVGAMPERGDTVVVQSLAAAVPAANAEQNAALQTEEFNGSTPTQGPVATSTPAAGVLWQNARPYVFAIGALMIIACVLGVWWGRSSRRTAATKEMTQAEREAALRQVQAWMQQDAVPATARYAPAGGPNFAAGAS